MIILQMKYMDMEVSNISRNAGDPKSLLKRFYELQTERVQTYKMFEEGFQAYLNSAPLFNFPLYRQLVHEITQTFLKISQEIVEIGTNLHDVHHLHTIASYISKIQEREQSKLDLTAGLQLSRQHKKDHPDDVKFQTEITETQANIMEVEENINEILEDIKYESEDLYLEENS
ncbi:required for excision 1-B domain-containing protein isoform X1 [Patella vulgata]|uniref:required for excision 1-B domain-containing protein isoform X1 n=2 Tax=Patella vulgata TaxID=6465 RepID=UPI00217F5E6B|nr:required for excision 1-B domain-containing protein isoform X1 [Patella vulgata]